MSFLLREFRQWVCGAVLLALPVVVLAEEAIKPFVLAFKSTGEVAGMVESVKSRLGGAGFEVIGEMSPYDGATIVVVTSPELKQLAAASMFGGYGAVQRVAITKVGDEIQVSYTNPVYMNHAYRMGGDASLVKQQLEAALGAVEAFGSKEGLTPKKLGKYHYMFGMEYFDDPSTLAEYKSHAEAVQAVESALAAGKGGASKVYRVDIPGKEQSVFGVKLTEGCSGDEFIMKNIDFKPLRSTAHLPYEMLVDGKTVYALYARFRIAINFPDLKMMGDNSFFKIMCAPDAIERALKQAAGVELE